MDIFNTIAEFVPETITLMFWLLFLSSSGLIFYWLKNKNKYLNHTHEVPESLIRDYQESINGNIEAQKSGVFSESKLASVMKAEDLHNNSQNISIINDQIKLLMAEIIDLKGNLKSRENIINQLERKIPVTQEENDGQEDFNSDELQKFKMDNEDLRAKLKEFELMEDDLFMLRDLKIENKNLRQKLGMPEQEDLSVVSGNFDEGEEVFNISGIKEEFDDFVRVGGATQEDEDNLGVDMRVKELKGSTDKKDVQFNDRQKSFGSVKIKDGNIFGSKKVSPVKKNKLDKVPESFGSVNVIDDEHDQDKDTLVYEQEAEVDLNDENIEPVLEQEEVNNVRPLKNKKAETNDEKKVEAADESSIESDRSAEELLDEFEKMLG